MDTYVNHEFFMDTLIYLLEDITLFTFHISIIYGIYNILYVVYIKNKLSLMLPRYPGSI